MTELTFSEELALCKTIRFKKTFVQGWIHDKIMLKGIIEARDKQCGNPKRFLAAHTTKNLLWILDIYFGRKEYCKILKMGHL